jgi:hypothetical protein
VLLRKKKNRRVVSLQNGVAVTDPRPQMHAVVVGCPMIFHGVAD